MTFYFLRDNQKVGAEKPNPAIFLAACELLKVKPEEAVHVGDDRRNDVWGARDAGCDAWLWGEDVNSFQQVILISVKSYHDSFPLVQYEQLEAFAIFPGG
jgi:FMN phosphatase YigB (HAD superfamily)